MSSKHEGLFIVLDGLCGAGKSTQIRELKRHFEGNGYEVVVTREPGGSPGAEEVRTLLVNDTENRWDGISELLLFAAARRNHVEAVIRPALEAGKIVLCDRFVASTVAYQGYGRGIPLAVIDSITKIAIGDLEPDLTLMFFIDLDLGIKRAIQNRNGTEPKYVSEDITFYKRVYLGFASYLARQGLLKSPRCIPIDIHEDQSISDVTASVLSVIRYCFPKLLPVSES